jgi:hypothetical protein
MIQKIKKWLSKDRLYVGQERIAIGRHGKVLFTFKIEAIENNLVSVSFIDGFIYRKDMSHRHDMKDLSKEYVAKDIAPVENFLKKTKPASDFP